MADSSDLVRQFVRHPSDVPIAWGMGELAVQDGERLKDVSAGGLAFFSGSAVLTGAVIDINIPLVDPQITLKGVVVWCAPGADRRYEIGVRFVDENDHFRMRMVEQICHIEHYKKEMFEREGRVLSGEGAALEWVSLYAREFPQ